MNQNFRHELQSSMLLTELASKLPSRLQVKWATRLGNLHDQRVIPSVDHLLECLEEAAKFERTLSDCASIERIVLPPHEAPNQRNRTLILATMLTRKGSKSSKHQHTLLRSTKARVSAFSVKRIMNRHYAGTIQIYLMAPELKEFAETALATVASRTRTLAENATRRSLATSTGVGRFIIRSSTVAAVFGKKQAPARNHRGQTRSLAQREDQQNQRHHPDYLPPSRQSLSM